MTRKSFLRAAVTLVLAGGVLAALLKFHLIDVGALEGAKDSPGTIAVIAAVLLGQLTFVSLRYRSLFRAMNKELRLRPVLAANFMGNAMSIWLPAPAAFLEVFRFGLITRAAGGADRAPNPAEIAVVGVVDRIVGLATVSIAGLAGGIYLMATGAVNGSGFGVLLVLTVGVLGACVAPFVAARNALCARTVTWLAKLGPLAILQRLTQAIAAVRLGSAAFWVAFVWSLGASAATSITTYLAFSVLGTPPALVAVAIGVPFIALSSLVPANFAGVGGSQLAAATIYAALGIEPRAAATASLLLATIGVLTATIAGLAWLPFYRRSAPASAAPAPVSPSLSPR